MDIGCGSGDGCESAPAFFEALAGGSRKEEIMVRMPMLARADIYRYPSGSA